MFKPTTEVLTKNGWKKIVDIEPDTDMVACVKPDTLGVQFKHVKHKLYLDNTPVVHFTNGIVATGEQRLIFYAEGGGCSRRIDFINNIKSKIEFFFVFAFFSHLITGFNQYSAR